METILTLPPPAAALLAHFAEVFTRPTFARWTVLVVGAVLTSGRRTVANMLRTLGPLAHGHASSYHRVLSAGRWTMWKAGKILAGLILRLLAPEGVVYVAGDDTVDEHRGKKVFGKGCHRDAVRSTHSFTAFRWGHKWVVLSILVPVPGARRQWALPVLVALYRPPDWNREHGRRHKTPAQLMRQLLAVLIHWFPERRFVFTGDGGYSTHALASFAHRHRARVTLVGRFYPDASLYGVPPARTRPKAGRPRKRGARIPSPKTVVARARRKTLTARWYGGGLRRVATVTRTAHWYKSGGGLVPIRWVFVHDLTGTHRDEYFFSTDPGMCAQEILEAFTGRWNIETTFQEMRAHLGLETTRGRNQSTVLRAAPSLFGLYSLIALIDSQIPARLARQGVVAWAGKRDRTFSDALRTVRRQFWAEGIFVTGARHPALDKLQRPLRALLLNVLAPAA